MKCFAYRTDGTLCGADAVALDSQRGCMVCQEHLPASGAVVSLAESQSAGACPMCEPDKFAVDHASVPEVRACQAHRDHRVLEVFNQPALRRRPLSAAEHNAFPNGRWSAKPTNQGQP